MSRSFDRPIVRLVFTCLFFVMLVSSWGQSILTPKWAANGYNHAVEHPKYSADGSRVIVWEQVYSTYSGFYGWSVYNVSDGKVLAHINIDAKRLYELLCGQSHLSGAVLPLI